MDHNLPAVPDPDPRFGDPTADPRDTLPMDQVPDVALAFALGYACARPQNASTFGPFLAVVEQLDARWSVRRGSSLPITRLGELLAALPMAMARSLSMLIQVQRGQRWAQTGTRHPGTGQHKPTDVGQ